MRWRLAKEIGCAAAFATATLVFVVAGSAAAESAGEKAKMVLCGAEKDGVHSFTAGPIDRAAKDAGIAVTVAADPMSKVNLMKLAEGDCDAAIVQIDALLLYKADHMAGRLMIAAPLHLFDKYLHLICRRGTGIKTVDDLLRDPDRYTLLIGEAGSASEMTWTALSKLESDYRQVGTRRVGGDEALAALLKGEGADCMLRMDGIGTAFMARIEAEATQLRLVPLDLFQLRDAEMIENRVYRSAIIPPDTYANLQAGLAEPAVETMAVGTMLVTDRAWARAHPEQHEALTRATAEAWPSLLKAVGQ